MIRLCGDVFGATHPSASLFSGMMNGIEDSLNTDTEDDSRFRIDT